MIGWLRLIAFFLRELIAGAVSVADLIAKIGAPTSDRHSHHRAADEADEPDEPAVEIDLGDTQIIDTPAYSLDLVSELPDLRKWETSDYPGDESDQDPAPKPKRGRRPMLLAARFILGASLHRTESRLSHFREDHPQRDDRDWLVWVDVAEHGGEPQFSRTPIPTPICPADVRTVRPTRLRKHVAVAGG